MHTNFLTRYAAFMLFLATGIDCMAVDKQQKELEAYLQKAFYLIYLAVDGLEYPDSVSNLNDCVKTKDVACLRTHKSVLEGKKMIKSIASTKVLDTTLDIIEKTCPSKDEEQANAMCDGGITSLYFYTLPEQDAKILNRIKNYPKRIRKTIFRHDQFWFYNRPNKDAWINAVSTMDVDWNNDLHKKRTLDLFRKSLAEMKDKTWVAK
jgi:hypothetical protein